MNETYFILPRPEKQPNTVNKPLKSFAYFKAIDSDFTVITYRALDAAYFRASGQWCEINRKEYQALGQMDGQS